MLAAGTGESGRYFGLTRHPAAVNLPPDSAYCDVEEDEAAALIFLSSCLPAPGRQRGFSSIFVFCPAYSRDVCVASQPGQPGVEPTAARCGSAIEEVIAVEGAAGSGTASATSVRVGCSQQLPARSAEAGPDAAALIGEPEPGPGQFGVAAAAGLPPQAAGRQSQGEPFVSGDDDEGLLAARVTADGATADPVKDYLKQIGKVPLLSAGQEVELAKRIEADRKSVV